jgi:methylthioribose-1-phosphate isomerase
MTYDRSIMNLPKTRALYWKKRQLLLLDQRELPHKTIWKTCRTWRDAAAGIKDMVVRGAPAIGITAAYGIVLAVSAKKFRSVDDARKELKIATGGLLAARPTAVNLRWALDEMEKVWNAPTLLPSREKGRDEGRSGFSRENHPSPQSSPLKGEDLVRALEARAIQLEEQDRAANQAMGRHGAALIPNESTVMTICNTGSLATGGLGTAFGVIWTAYQEGKVRKVIASETRPYLQGARLTAWELQKERIPFELMTDNMAAHLMKTEKIDAVLAGADRIAANGDSANKIGTYSLAVLAAHHKIPFYIVAPLSTVDLKTPNGDSIPIEERSVDEVTMVRGLRIAPKGIKARHPAFDVTPASMITGIITERGVARAPFENSLPQLFRAAPPAPAAELIRR